MHYILITLTVYIVFLIMFPQQVAAGTLLLVASLMDLVDWTVVPWGLDRISIAFPIRSVVL